MKYIITLALLIGIIGVPSVTAQDKADQFQIQVDGLGCPFCAYGLEKKFKEFKGIKNVSIDIETGLFTFSLPSVQQMSMERVELQVQKAGYTPIKTKIIRASGEIVSSEGRQKVNAQVAQLQSRKVHVSGNCEMCKARIEAAARKVTGVQDAVWDIPTKLLSVTYHEGKATLDSIEKAIAVVGHDTPNHKAGDGVYRALPPCCHYERSTK